MSGDHKRDELENEALERFEERDNVDAPAQFDDPTGLEDMIEAKERLGSNLKTILRDYPYDQQADLIYAAIEMDFELRQMLRQIVREHDGNPQDKLPELIKKNYDDIIALKQRQVELEEERLEINASVGKLAGHDQTKDTELTIHELVTGGNESVLETNAAGSPANSRKQREKKKKEQEQFERALQHDKRITFYDELICRSPPLG